MSGTTPSRQPAQPRSPIRVPRRPRWGSPGVLGLIATVAAVVLTASACGSTAQPTGVTGASGQAGASAGASSQANADTQPALGDPGIGDTAKAADILAGTAYSATDVAALIDALDATRLADRPKDMRASVRPGELQLTGADGAQATLPIPAEKFYLSVAPYIDGTHECHFHSLTTCKGELGNADLDVTVTNAETGEKIVTGSHRTFDNGFVGLWLPRGIDATITVAYQGKSATAKISTKTSEDATCLTTMQLA